jgi:hypothetical protein
VHPLVDEHALRRAAHLPGAEESAEDGALVTTADRQPQARPPAAREPDGRPSRSALPGRVAARSGVWVARSANGGRAFSVRAAAKLPSNQAATCAFVTGKYPTPTEATQRLGPNPTVTTAGSRVYVTYAGRDLCAPPRCRQASRW